MDTAQCPICQRLLPVIGLERHVNAHLDECERASDHALASSTSQTEFLDADCWDSGPVTCLQCCSKVSLKDWADHDAAHEVSEEDSAQSNQLNGEERQSDTDTTIKKQRTGTSLASCSGMHVPHKLETCSLVVIQKKGIFKPVEEGIMNLLRNCLKLETWSLSCTIISSHIDHFESCLSEDFGWGCGWRNIQMLSSHLLMRQWASKVLYGGAGFVPDIPSLQQWLEVAWSLGFDKPGAEFYHHKIHGTKEWIGTTECAALFRSFGLRARIVDFSSAGSALKKNGQASIERWLQRVPAKDADAQSKTTDQMLESEYFHHSVQCDVCGAYPIKGIRYKSKRKSDYDLCSSCMFANNEKLEGFEKIVMPSGMKGSFNGKEVATDEDVNHECFVNWVWSYLTGGIKDLSLRACADQLQGHVLESDCTPLYFQHQGHSRTIVGMQRRRKNANSKEEIFLLVLDPSTRTQELVQSLRGKRQWQKLIKRGVHTLKKQSYQVCYIEPGIAQEEELEQLKILKSEQFMY